MSKEMVISANRHETKVAILEDDLLVEAYFQRSNEYSLAGSIHKGRVTRVLPGMQSAFVDLGLERDTFLYVSDFLEEHEDFDKITGEERAPREQRGGREELPHRLEQPNLCREGADGARPLVHAHGQRALKKEVREFKVDGLAGAVHQVTAHLLEHQLEDHGAQHAQGQHPQRAQARDRKSTRLNSSH